MAERMVLGVDFSGRGTDNATWVTTGCLRGEVLEVVECCRMARKREKAHSELEKRLLKLAEQPDNAVIAMDFPFSLPRKFAVELSPRASTMPDVWHTVAEDIKEYHLFKKLCDSFVVRHGEMMRRGDVNFGGPFSPLKTDGINMLPMTFYGMLMLHRLWTSGKKFQIPPLLLNNTNAPTLLETMPGVLLRNFELPAKNYKTKNQSNNNCPKDVREKILIGLKEKFGRTLKISDHDERKCRDNADSLDSLVATIGAAMWAISESQFLIPRKSIPQSEEYDYAQIEGWIYAPRK